MIYDINTQVSRDREIKLSISIDTILFWVLLAIIFCVRITNITYNTLFVDEALYASVGKNVLSGIFSQKAMSWMYGSYFYPLLAATVNSLMGEVGLRVLSSILSTVAAIFVFLATARLFDKQSALWAMLIFGMTAISIDIGQYAVYDSLAMPLLAITFYCLIMAASVGVKESIYLQVAAISFILATFSKYFVDLYLPVLMLMALSHRLLNHRSIYPLFTKFLGPIVLALGIYAFFYRYDLFILLTGEFGVSQDTRWNVLQAIWEEIGVVSLIALVGGCLAARRWLFNSNTRTKRALVLSWLLIPMLALSAFAGPLYHLAVANNHAAWKHTVYSLIFLAPMAGYGCMRIIAYFRLRQERLFSYYRLIGVAITMIGVIWYVDHALERNGKFQHSWPNVTNVVAYMHTQGLIKGQHILAEGAEIYEYYFDFDASDQAMWQDTWFMEYKGVQGTDAMTAAVLDRKFDFVVLDDYYTPGLRKVLEPALFKAGYSIGYAETQKLGSGDTILMCVYIPSK